MLRLPPGMARPSIPKNPSPSLITAELWEFAYCVISLEPNDFVFAGIYADKSGYHNTVARNLSRWPGEYSSRLSSDLSGDRSKARAVDIKSKQAASGAAPTIMAKYGARMRAAAKARDPRVRHWREVLGQFDTDRAPEAIDFQSVAEREPDDTHEWHFHWSIFALYVALAEAYEGMLSVLYGESLNGWNEYKPSGSGGSTMGYDSHENVSRRLAAMWEMADKCYLMTDGTGTKDPKEFAVPFVATIKAIAAEVSGLREIVVTLAGVIKDGGGDVDTAGLFARIDAAVERAGAEARDAVADLAEGGAPKVRADAAD